MSASAPSAAAPLTAAPRTATPRAALAVLGRAPRAGAAKTRLAPALGPDGAAHLYAAFLADTLALALAAGDAGLADATLWAAGAADDRALLEVPGARDLPRRAQPAGDLGVRLAAALDAGVASHGRALVIGSDAPTLPLALLRAASAALDAADLVLGPSADGGYFLIGARVAVGAALFDGVRFSTRFALLDTLTGAARLGLSVARTAPWYDVDTPDDLRVLGAHLSLAPTLAPHTRRALRLYAGFDRPSANR